MEKGIVFKYPINISGSTVIKVPVRSQFLSIKAQGDTVVAYFLENAAPVSSEGVTEYRFYSVGTGHSFTIDKGMEYLNTVLLYDDRFVLHIFKV